jgi:ABC-type polysaccharide/polyol phosphate transport system ATPase subunit
MNTEKKFFVNIKNVSLDIEHFSKEYRLLKSFEPKSDNKNKKILNNISLEIKEGDKLGIIGPNGAGKSTLLRLIAEIYKPTSGEFSKKGRCIGYFGNIFYDEYMTGIEFIINSLMLFNHTKKEVDLKIDKILNFIDIGEYIYKTFNTYSEGMKARVSLATIIFAKPNILLIDEGIGAGDRFFIQKTKDAINQMLLETPILVMSSHDEEMLLKFCKTSILMSKGQIIRHENTQKILDFYKSEEFKNTIFPI